MTAAEELLLNDVRAFINRYVWFPTEHHAVVVTLWIAHTWCVNAFYTTPRLILDSAEPGSGKTRVLELLALLCRSAKLTLSTTTAALYRRIAAATEDGHSPPTILQDESDAIFGKHTSPQTEDLRALFNAGYKRGATVDRCEGDAKNMKVREFPVFAPVALAGLAGKMPDTITTRAVTLHMRRRRPGDHVAEYRERDAKLYATPLSDRLELWASETTEQLADARPAMPDGVQDRAAEVWEPLLAIADHAGGDWPTLARKACCHFVLDSAADDEKLSLGQRLLRDIKAVMDSDGSTAMWSSDIIAKLTANPESEWSDLWGKKLDQRRLANEMKRYGVKPKTIRIGVATSRGYDIDGPTGLRQAWDHWLAASISDTADTANTSQVNAFRSVSDSEPSDTHPTQTNMCVELHERGNVLAVSAVSDISGLSETQPSDTPSLCPECRRAPARSDTRLCDFCTVKHRRQQTPLHKPTLSAAKWFANHIAALQAEQVLTATTAEVYGAGEAAGYTRNALASAANAHPDVTVVDRSGGVTTWSIRTAQDASTEAASTYRSVDRWLTEQIDQCRTDRLIPAEVRAAAEAAGYQWSAVRTVAARHPGIDSQPAHGQSKTERIWFIRREGQAS